VGFLIIRHRAPRKVSVFLRRHKNKSDASELSWLCRFKQTEHQSFALIRARQRSATVIIMPG
jgi:hypothetical protein